MHDLASLRGSFSIVGEVVLSMAHGSARFDQTQVFSGWEFGKSFGGRVLVSNVGNSIVPDYPLDRKFSTVREGGILPNMVRID